MPTVTKKDLIDRIADATGQKRVLVKDTVQAFLDEVIIELGKGNRLEFRDFGVFEIRKRKPRMAQNPKTLEPVEVPSKRVVKFKVGRRMQQTLDGDVEPPISIRRARAEADRRGTSRNGSASSVAAADVRTRPVAPARRTAGADRR
jgi:integration host factor subunit beta